MQLTLLTMGMQTFARRNHEKCCLKRPYRNASEMSRGPSAINRHTAVTPIKLDRTSRGPTADYDRRVPRFPRAY